MKKVTYDIGVFNRNQLLFIAACEKLRLFKYVDFEENEPVGRMFDCPITEKVLCVVWKVESYEIVKRMILMIRNMLFDEAGNRNVDYMIRLGNLKKNP